MSSRPPGSTARSWPPLISGGRGSSFRYSLPCIEAGCSQWNGSGCGLADLLTADCPPLARRRPRPLTSATTTRLSL
jgi:hypothetical protein